MKHYTWYSELESILRQAGKILLAVPFEKIRASLKDSGGLVTQVDLEIEKFLKAELKRVKSDAEFIAEESGTTKDASYMWVIDPIDGTTNFSRGLPYFCISVALVHNEIPIVAAIYEPIKDRLFYAEQGKGSVANLKPIKVSNRVLSESLIVNGPVNRKSGSRELKSIAFRLIYKARTTRHFGAIALDLANIAQGAIDGLFLANWEWWDVAAGILLVTEAGGLVTTGGGEPLKPGRKTCIAGGIQVYQAIKGLFDQRKD